MIILRLIYLNKGPSPEDLLNKYKNKNQNELKNNNIEKDILTNKKEQHNDEKINENTQENNLISNENSSILIHNFRNFVELFYTNKEGLIHSKLYNNTNLISFKEG